MPNEIVEYINKRINQYGSHDGICAPNCVADHFRTLKSMVEKEPKKEIQPQLEEWLRSWQRAERDGFPLHLTASSISYYVKLLEKICQ